MSGSGSISRKRVGSVSQPTPPPLDIQSISMPPNPQNALALKTAALSSNRTLFQTCTALRRRLRNVEDFAPFLEQPETAPHLDIVSHMCHVLRLGSSLCHLYNLLLPSFSDPSSQLFMPNLPPPKQIEYDFPAFYDAPEGVFNWAKRPENSKVCQRYIAHLMMALKQRESEGRWKGEIWALHELWGKSTGDDVEAYDSTGLMKVLHTVETMLDHLPASALRPASPNIPYGNGNHASMPPEPRYHQSSQSYDVPFSMGGHGSGAGAVAAMAATMNGGVHIHAPLAPGDETMRSESAADANAYKSVEELVASEKSYVHELEILARCAQEMLDVSLVSTETYHRMFSNLGKILEFHRKFLIKLETEYEPISEGRGSKAWAEGRWGRPFVTSEPDFACYGPYCANYLEAITLVTEQMPVLMRGQDLPHDDKPCLEPTRELQAFMIKPIQRITKYGLLLDAILHATAKHDYPYRSELEDGAAAVRRIAASINEVTDFKAKQATVRELIERVEDWKGHDVDKFGDLWLDDFFTVTKGDQPRDYHVFLFDRMMLCCKEIVPERKGKTGKSSSMLRKDKSWSKTVIEKRKLALKGRIFVSNIAKSEVLPPDPSDPYAARLVVGWTVPSRHPDGTAYMVDDSFVMAGKSEDQIKKWADKIADLALAERKRLTAERAERMAQDGRYSQQSAQSHFAPPTPAVEMPPHTSPPPMPGYGGGWQDDDDESGLRSGRTTPSIGSSAAMHAAGYGPPSRSRVQSQQGFSPAPAEAGARTRAVTEDHNGPSMSQWRSNHSPGPMHPPLPRLTSAMSAMSTMSEASFGTSFPASASGSRPTFSRNPSSARLGLGPAEEVAEEETQTEQREASFQRYGSARGMMRTPSSQSPMTVPHPASLRNRSASSPNVYQQPRVTAASGAGGAPPIPSSTAEGHKQPQQWHGVNGGYDPGYSPRSNPMGMSSSATLVGGTAYFTKRMSNGKRSSGESHTTETSETSSGQSPATPYSSSATPTELRGSRSFAAGGPGGTVMVRIKWGEAQLVIGIPADITFAGLQHKVAKKIRTATGSPCETLQIRWIDSDNDEVSLKNDADVEGMFDEVREFGLAQVHLVAR